MSLRSLRYALSAIRLAPHIALLLLSGADSDLSGDVRFNAIRHAEAHLSDRRVLAFIQLMTLYREFRNVFYFRAGRAGRVFSFLCRPRSSMALSANSIGPGLFVNHGVGTIIIADRIGSECWLYQGVTLGHTPGSTGPPTIGDDVRIYAGAKVLGNLTVGDHVVIGANAVVIKDVPSGCTVVGVPARIVRRDGLRVDEPL